MYSVVDGQQRLRAILEYIDGRFPLSESKDKRWRNKRFAELPQALQENILNYDLTIEELTGYRDDDIRDVFVRMNKYVVKLSPQELRHARDHGQFYEFVEELARGPFWREQRVFTTHQLARMKSAEFAAELTILLIEGPQDKKNSLDLYYGKYQRQFPYASDIARRLTTYQKWVLRALPHFPHTRYRKPTDFYGLIGALDSVSRAGKRLARLDAAVIGKALTAFEKETHKRETSRLASAYVIAASRQTDNIGPRNTRIEILSSLFA